MNQSLLLPDRPVLEVPRAFSVLDIPDTEFRQGMPDGQRRVFTIDRVTRPMVEGGAVTVSGGYILTWKAANDGTDVVIDWVNDACKGALYNNSITPNFSTDTRIGAAPYTTNEISGTGYTAGGVALAGKTFTESPAGTLMYDANDPAWTGATFSLARCLVIYDTTLSSPSVSPLLLLINFAADYGVTAGTFTVQLPSTGAIADDITP